MRKVVVKDGRMHAVPGRSLLGVENPILTSVWLFLCPIALQGESVCGNTPPPPILPFFRLFPEKVQKVDKVEQNGVKIDNRVSCITYRIIQHPPRRVNMVLGGFILNNGGRKAKNTFCHRIY